MKMKNMLRKAISLLCVIALLVTNLVFIKASEVQASENNLTEIGWDDFSGAEVGKTYSTAWKKFTYNDTSVTTLNNTKFVGQIQFSDNSGIRYGGSAESFGLHIYVKDGKLGLRSDTFTLSDDLATKTFEAAQFGITSGTFANTPFMLTITMTDVTTTTATVGVWVNDIAVDESFTITENGQWNASLGNTICIMDGNYTGSVTIPKPLPPTDLTEIGWADFGITSDTTYADYAYVTYADGESLDGTLFSGDIMLTSTTDGISEIRYAARADGWVGLHVCVAANGWFYLVTDTNYTNIISGREYLANGNKYYFASDFGLGDSFSGKKFNLKISTEVEGDNYTFGVWINDIMVGDYFTLAEPATSSGSRKQIGFDMNQSGNVTVYLEKAGYTDITWKDFGAGAGTYNTAWQYFTYQDTTATTLNNTRFTGQIQFSEMSGIRYGGSSESFGLHLSVQNGKLVLESHTFTLGNLSTTSLDASDYGIASGTFADAVFDLTITMTDVTSTYAVVGVWVNDIAVDESFTMTSTNDAYQLGTKICIFDGNTLFAGGTVTIPKVLPPTNLTPIGWENFGVAGGSAYVDHAYVTYADSDTLNGTLFTGDIMVDTTSGGSEIRYASSGDGSWGLHIGVNENGQFYMQTHTMDIISGSTYLTAYNATDFGLTTFSNTKFSLKISTEIDGNNYTFGVWVNDIMVGDYFTLGAKIVSDSKYSGGNQIGLDINQNGAIYIPASVDIPEDLTQITWEEFGIAANTAYQLDGTLDTIIYGTASHYTNLNNTLFNGDIVMTGGSYFRYGGSQGDFGLWIQVTSDEKLSLTSDTFTLGAAGKTYVPELFGLTSFADTKFNLKIAMTDVTDTTATVCVWINDQAVAEAFTMTSRDADVYKTGTCLALYSGTITPHTIFKQPTGLPTIAFKDFNNNQTNSNGEAANGAAIENGTYGRNWIQAVYSGDDTTLLNKSFRDTVRMETGQAYTDVYYYTLQYGGSTSYGQDGGIRISLVGDNLVLHPAVTEFTGTWTLTPDKVGLQSFKSTEFQLGIDAVEYGEHVLLWLYFDGVCYNNAPFFLRNFASQMTNTLMVIAGNGSMVWLADKFIIGATMKTLTSVHHDLALGGYELPTDLKAISGQTYDGETIVTTAYTGGSTIEQTGIYTIQFNDGVSLYEQTIYLALTGDNNCNGEIDSCDLVRLLKLVRTTDYALSEGAEAAADADNNGFLAEEDVDTLRDLILGLDNSAGDVMPIIGFRGPTGDLLTDDIYELISKAGINTVMQYENQFSDVASNRYLVYQQLTLAQNHNIKITVSDVGLRTDPSSVTTDKVTNATSKYDYFQSYAGLWLVDEPGDEYFSFEGRETLIDYYSNLALRAREAKQEIFSTLQPFHKTSGDDNSFQGYKGASYNYVQYLRNCIDKFNPSMLTYDYYPFDKDKTANGVGGKVEDASQYFQNLAMVRTVAQAANDGAGMPFWYTVQAGTNWNDDPTASLDPTTNDCPTRGEFKWNVNTALAFGAKGIQYFPMIQPSYFANTTDGTMDYQRNGLIGADGNTTKWYTYAQETNAQIAAIDHVLMNATSMGLMSTGGYSTSQATDVVASMILYEKTSDVGWDILDQYTERETLITQIHDSYNGAAVTSSDTTYGALTGCFATSNGKYALYIVNYNPASENTITVNFGSEKTVSVTANAVTEEQTASTITKTLGAGEAMLIVY